MRTLAFCAMLFLDSAKPNAQGSVRLSEEHQQCVSRDRWKCDRKSFDDIWVETRSREEHNGSIQVDIPQVWVQVGVDKLLSSPSFPPNAPVSSFQGLNLAQT
jgi:hypothetical protein